MSLYGSQQALNMSRRAGSKSDLTGGGNYLYSRSEVLYGGGNGYDPYMDGHKSFSYSKTTTGGLMSGTLGGTGGGMMMSGSGGGMMSGTLNSSGGVMISGAGSGAGGPLMSGTTGRVGAYNITAIRQRAMSLQSQCQEYLKKAELALQSGSSPGEAERYMAMAKDTIEQLKSCAADLRQMGQPVDNVVRTVEQCKDQLKGVHMAITGTTRRRSTRGSSGGWEEPGRSFHDAIGWIAQQKRLIETATWGDDPSAIEQQLVSHQRFHNSIQRSTEVDRARDDLMKKGDRGNLHALEQEWDSLQQMSCGRAQQLRDLQQIIQEVSKEIMWVNDREEEELVFDWGDKNIEQYIPRKQESYSKLMCALEDKEIDLNKLKARVDTVLKNGHPASDKIEAYQDTLQTQWSWLLQITKCIDIHLKENAAYSQFFKEANETFSTLQKQHETIRKKFACDKSTPLENLIELVRGLERERERIMENKRQVQHLLNKSKSIVRLKPRNPEEKSSSPIIVKALCDFTQDQKVICKDNEAILKDNSQRSKWLVTGPGGLDMLVPSVCLIIPPPNPLSISLSNKNEQYYEAILTIWNQLYINVKSLIAWRYCLLDIKQINTLTLSMLSKMRPEEYHQIIKNLEAHYEEFKMSCHDSQMFADEDKRNIENQFTGAQTRYDQLVMQLPTYITQYRQEEAQQAAEQQQQLIIIQQQQQVAAAAEAEARRLEEERQRAELKKQAQRKTASKKEQVIKKDVVKVTKTEQVKKKVPVSSSTSRSLSELHALRLRLEAAEGSLSQHVHICFGDEGVHDCGLRITQLEAVQRDIDSMQEEFLRLREHVLMELEDMSDSDKAQFLRSETDIINQRLGSLESSSSAYLQRLRALRDMLESVARFEDIVKVYEARLTEKETTSLSPREVEDYISTLKNIKAEVEQKKDVLASMEAELAKACHWNGLVGGPFPRCDMMLSKYTEQVGLLSDRWRRIQGQIDTRLQDLQLYLPQLQHYKQTSTSFSDWIDVTRKEQAALQAMKIENLQTLKDQMNKQKEMNTEIKAKRDTLESVLKDNEACVNSVKDYEMYLASYTSGLETLLNIPIKRTMLKSPSMELNQEATQLQTRYMELLTLSGDYYKFLGELLRNMEELKIRNTRIDLLEEELRLLRENMHDHNTKNKSLEDAVARYELELSKSKNQLLSMEEVKRSAALQCSASKDSLDTTQGQLANLNDQVTRLNYMLEEEKRKRKLAEERYTHQQEEYESVLRKRQKELETVSWSKLEMEKSVVTKDYEIEQLRRQLAEEEARAKELQKEITKVRSQCSAEISKLKLNYESQINISHTEIQRLASQRNEDSAELHLQFDRMESEKRNLEEELRMLRITISEAEEQKVRAEEEARSQSIVITEEGHRRRELENQVEMLMRQREQDSSQYKEELAEVMNALQEKSEQVAYVTHSLEEETRRRKTVEEGQVVLEQSLAQLQVKLTNSSVTATQLRECEEELQNLRLELERERRERNRVEVNMNRLQGRIRDLQSVRDGLESQVEDLRRANQEEVAKRRQAEAELEKNTMSMTEYKSTITVLRQNQEQASSSGKRGEEERVRLQEELVNSMRQNKAYAEKMTQLTAEVKALQQQLLQEQARVKEANLKNESLYKSVEEKTEAQNVNSVELQRLKELTETQAKERLKLEEKLRVAIHDKEELLRTKQGHDDELSSQITALDLQLQASERSNVEYRNLVSELSSEREKLKLEAERIHKQATETTVAMQSIHVQYTEIEKERDALLLKLQMSVKDKDRFQMLEEELSRIKLSLDSELRNKQRLQEENERATKDLSYWKDQYDSKQSLIRQYDTDKERLEREKNSLRSETERLMKEQRELEEMYKSRLAAIQKELQEVTCVRQTMHTELKSVREPPNLDASTLIFDGVRKTVTADQLLDCGVLDKPTFSQLVKGHKTVPEVSVDKKVNLKGTGPIAGVVLEGPSVPGSNIGPLYKLSFTEAKSENLLPPDCVDLLLDAQAATGHIIDPRTNQKFTVEQACNQGVAAEEDRERLSAAEAAAVGYSFPGTSKPLSVFQAMKKGLTDKNTTLRLLQAQESVGGILDPGLSVFLPRDTAVERDLIDDDVYRALNRRPELYLDPESEEGVTYMSIKRKCRVELNTGLLLLPVGCKTDPAKLVFDGVRKPVTAKQLLDCGVIDKTTFKELGKGIKAIPEVSVSKKVNLKGTGPIAGVIAGSQGKMSISEAKKLMLLPEDCADLLLEAQAATGHIIDPTTNQKLTVEEACAKGVVDTRDRDRLLNAEAAAVGYWDTTTAKPLSVFEAMKKGLIDRKTGLRYLQAQEAVGGILDPNLSVFLPNHIAIKHNLLDENLHHALGQSPCYLDPENEKNISYRTLKERCKKESHTGLLLLPISEQFDPSKLRFDGVRKTVTAQQLLDCGVLDKPTFNQLIKGEKTVPQVSIEKRVFLKGTGSIAGVAAGSFKKMSFTEAKKKKIMSSESADMLLDAQIATGHIIDPRSNQKLTVKEAFARGIVDKEDESRLFAIEAAAIGYRDPSTTKLRSVGQAMRMGLIDRDTTLRILQAQECVGGILDPTLSVFLPKDIARERNLIDDDLYQALTGCPKCYLDPATQQATTYMSLTRKCTADPGTSLLFLPEPKKPLTVQGLRGQVSVIDLLDANLLARSDMDQLSEGRLTSHDIEDRLCSYLRGSTCIAGVYDEANEKVMSIYQAMKDGLLRPGTTLELLEAQAASGFIVDPVYNLYLTVSDAYSKRLFGPEFKDNLLAAERAVTGYKVPGTDQIISLFQAIERGLVERGHGIRLLEAQIASGGIIDPEHSHRINVNVAYKRGYFDEKMNKILTGDSADTKGFFDPNTEENLTYLELKKRCITDKKTGLILLPIMDKKLESTLKNTLRKRRVIIVDPETNKEMTVREAYNKKYIDYDTFLELSQQECEWEEITITAPDGSERLVINDKKTGRQYDINDLLERRIIDQSVLNQYRSRDITINEFADIIANKTKTGSLSSALSTSRPSAASTISSMTSSSTLRKIEASGPLSMTSTTSSSSSSSSSVVPRPLSPTLTKMTTTKTTTTTISNVAQDPPDPLKHKASVSITITSAAEAVGEQQPVGAIFDTETVEKISIMEALNRGLVDSITAQRLLEAQACTGGIVNPTNGRRLGIQEAARLGIINDDMASNLKPAQKAYIGFEDVKTRRKMSVAEAMKEMWIPYEAGQRFMEYQFITGGIYDPELGCRRSIEDALKMGWLDGRSSQKLQDIRHHAKNLTCPKSKLKISYKEALDNCLVEESTGLKMLQASTVSSRGISSPYNVASAPGSTTGSRSGSKRSSRRSSVDLGSSTSSLTTHYSHTSFTNFSSK